MQLHLLPIDAACKEFRVETEAVCAPGKPVEQVFR